MISLRHSDFVPRQLTITSYVNWPAKSKNEVIIQESRRDSEIIHILRNFLWKKNIFTLLLISPVLLAQLLRFFCQTGAN